MYTEDTQICTRVYILYIYIYKINTYICIHVVKN